MQLKSLTYTSVAVEGLGQADLDRILLSARTYNPLDGITGILFFNGVSFLQLIEGAEQAVEELAFKIKQDQRHRDFKIRDCRTIERRAFPDWAMSYARIGGSAAEARNYQQALNRDIPDVVRTLLLEMGQAAGVVA